MVAAARFRAALCCLVAAAASASVGRTPAPAASADADSLPSLVRAPLSFFDLELLTPKGPRKNPDVGTPEDFTRPLAVVDDGRPAAWSGATVGSWACTEGGWDSPKPRATTETFFVLDGAGCVTDLDGVQHAFGPGDTVILPKYWRGRWDVMRRIHKVWVVVDHDDVPGAADGVVRAVVTPLASLAPDDVPSIPRGGALRADRELYRVGTTTVGCTVCTPGGWARDDEHATTAECFHVLDGAFSLTPIDGSAQRCTAGDMVVLPRGWRGHWDIITTATMLWVKVEG